MRSRIATLLAVPLLAFALLASWAGPASAETDTDSNSDALNPSRHLPIPSPASDNAAAQAEQCLWDVAIVRTASGNLTGQLAVTCNAIMAEIAAQIVLIWNGNPRTEASGQFRQFNTQNALFTLPVAVACLPGDNWAYGAVAVQSYSGGVASDFGESLNTITC